MKQKLKKSFVKITMVSAILVLALLMGIVNLANAVERRNNEIEILQYLADNGGRFPINGKEDPDGPQDVSEDGFQGEKGKKFSGRHMTAETPYETRYFSVLLDEEGEVLSVDTSKIASITEEEAADLANRLQREGKNSGRSGYFRYMKVEKEEGVQYLFLDCSKNIDSSRSFLIISIVVTLIGLAILFVVAWLLSGRAIRPIIESYEKQKSFITNAGHELKTPLAIISSSVEVIELEGGESRWTQSIHGQVKRLSGLTQELVALARMDEEAHKVELSQMDASGIILEALEPYAMMADQKEIRFTMDVTEGICLKTNREALEKICAILADNALKYTEDAGEIRFAFGREGNRVVLREENPAKGLTAGKQEKLFDRFYRGDSSRNSSTPGYGLGLPLARSLAEAMGGKMYAECPDGKKLVIKVLL